MCGSDGFPSSPQAYSQDAYLKGNDAYSGNAQHIPEPPPICYPRIDPKPAAMAQPPDPAAPSAAGQGGGGAWLGSPPGGGADTGYRLEIPVPPSPPPPAPKAQTVVCVCSESVRTAVAPPSEVRLARGGQGHRTEEGRYGPPGASLHLVRSRPSGGALQYPPAGRTAGYPPCPDSHPSPSVRSSLAVPADPYPDPAGRYSPSSPSPSATSPAAHQNIDWRNYTTYREYIDAKRLHMYGCRTIQERLDSLRAAAHEQPPARGAAAGPVPLRRRSTSHDRAYPGPVPLLPPRSASQERLGPADARDWPRSASQDALPSAPLGAPKPRARSCDYLVRQDVPPPDRPGYGRAETEALIYREAARTGRHPPQPPRAALRTPGGYAGGGGPRGALSAPLFAKGTEQPPASRAESLLLHSAPPAGNRSLRLPVKGEPAPSPGSADAHKDQRAPAPNHLAHASQRQRPRAESARELGPCARSPSKAPSPSQQANGAATLRAKAREGAGPGAVLMREKSAAHPIRHHSYILAVTDPEAEPGTDSTCWLPNDARREVNMRRLDEQRKASCSSNLDDSLDSIPFIGERCLWVSIATDSGLRAECAFVCLREREGFAVFVG